MSVVIFFEGTSSNAQNNSNVQDNESTAGQVREPRLCWRELVLLAMDGTFPSDQRLEHLLDRIERLP